MRVVGPGEEPQPVVYLVATSHLDTQWRWTVRDTIRDYLPATLGENFALFESEPAYVLSFEGAFRYMLIREYYPEDYERLKEWVRKGRWRVAGSMLDAPDVNIVSPESLTRHILYGNGFFEDELGRRSEDLFLPDCFGFGQALPSIAAHCGLRGFSAQKFGRWMAPAEIPFDLGVWEGPDGRGVVAAIRPGGYGEGLPEDPSRNGEWVEELETSRERHGVAVGLKYFGIGDRGGAVGPESIENLRKGLAGEGELRIVHSGSDQLFRDLDDETVSKLPRHRGELLLPRHGTGCLTSQAALKRWNRKNELLADAAERAAVMASWLAGARYPAEELREAWGRFLWHQMHDDLTGTSIPEAYRITVNDQAVAMNRFETVLADSISVISRGLDTKTEGEPVVVYNPLSWERDDVVEAGVAFPGGTPAAVRVVQPDGSETPGQILPGKDGATRVAFRAMLPPVGVAVCEVQPTESSPVGAGGLSVGDDFLENERLRAEIDANGDLSRLYDKKLGRELLSSPVRLQLLEDNSTRWPAWEVLYDDLVRPPRGHFGAPAKTRVAESGPVRVALEVRRRAGRSTLTQRYRLASGGERLEVECDLDWQTRRRLLKAAFTLASASATATYDLGLGVIERGNNTEEKYEVPAQQWADLSNGEFGVSVLNDCKYGWDKPDDGTLRLSLVRSPRALRRFRHQGVQDFGEHRFTYALYPHAGSWSDDDTVAQAARLDQPPMAFKAERHEGALGRSFSFLRPSDAGLAVTALKQAEKGDEVVLRVRETRGHRLEESTLGFATPIVAAREIDGCERDLGPASLDGERLGETLDAFQPRSFALRLEPPQVAVDAASYQQISLPFDSRGTSRQGEARPRGFDGNGHSFPAELFPERLFVGETELELGPAEGANFLACAGQVLELPPGEWRSLVLVAAAIEGDADARILVGERPHQLRIQDWASPIASPEVRRDIQGLPWAPPRPGYLKTDSIAWTATHRHDPSGADEPYRFGYLFRYTLPISPRAEAIRLPEAARIRMVAAAVVADPF